MKKTFGALLAVGCVATAIACSSSSNNNGGGGGASSCFASFAGTSAAGSACESCEQSSCSSQMSGVQSGCADALACICPGGTYNASLVQGCASKAAESSCTSASQAMSQCVSQNCASQCSGSASSSSGGSSSGGGSSGVVASCQVASQNVCYVFKNGPPETASGDGAECSFELQGTTVASCPTTGLLGCCTYTTPSDYECFYQGSGAQGCAGGTGVGNWDTTTLP